MVKKELCSRVFTLCFIFSIALVLAGCKGGGGGSAGGGIGGTISGGDSGASSVNLGSDSIVDNTDTDSSDYVATTHQPEPSSMLLLGSGLLGMALARLKRKKR